MKILGIDISPNHGGFVLLDGTEVDFLYLTNIKGSADRSKKGIYLKKIKGEKDLTNVLRLAYWKAFFEKVLKTFDPDYIGIEGYAFRATSNSSYQIGELGGLVRIIMFEAKIPYRIHDPLSIKMYATGKGSSVVDDLFFILPKDLQRRFPKTDPLPTKRTKKINTQTSRDLAVAYWVAQLVQTEVKLRKGKIVMSDLNPHQIRVFNRVTKTNPINILARNWIAK